MKKVLEKLLEECERFLEESLKKSLKEILKEYLDLFLEYLHAFWAFHRPRSVVSDSAPVAEIFSSFGKFFIEPLGTMSVA